MLQAIATKNIYHTVLWYCHTAIMRIPLCIWHLSRCFYSCVTHPPYCFNLSSFENRISSCPLWMKTTTRCSVCICVCSSGASIYEPFLCSHWNYIYSLLIHVFVAVCVCEGFFLVGLCTMPLVFSLFWEVWQPGTSTSEVLMELCVFFAVSREIGNSVYVD